MPIDPDLVIGAVLPERPFVWTAQDVLRYNLALGAGADPADVRDMRYVRGPFPSVLPTFGLTAPATFGVAAPEFYRADASGISYPGLELDFTAMLQDGVDVIVHRPIPAEGRAVARARVVDLFDTGKSAVIAQEADLVAVDGSPLLTTRSDIFVRGEGGFGGPRGPSRRNRRVPTPDGAPAAVLDTPTLPEQALLYQLCGDRNPLHADPEFARSAGFPRPILQGMCTLGMVFKAVADEILGGDATSVVRCRARFTGVVYPGETLRSSVWVRDSAFIVTTSVRERPDTPVLSDVVITVGDRPHFDSPEGPRPRGTG
ncbi:3-alpha,7-alpha,12-alpha-trihydroxy-5-beta-cholest-24-enoyl-CoA hydratase [Yinghuangia sp. ASG 101]|uniref:MaoC/PaaZ C-terminal domain-containing protein n=1 Tax=Yinghuangia sp. ASG 101 TaxID=2896848 RepID=UPI001E546BC8|nr:MaoC/PaaZ C-terminal domain-containing protein [Yinghuangia sp. ASG 101]UGQ11303.1 3-alpha,7-alpha,12-alpha-trihydroxy-5-beta-cholest-24-enoyl-CoA hydratase [Yinghuangia sp. ASG 101]